MNCCPIPDWRSARTDLALSEIFDIFGARSSSLPCFSSSFSATKIMQFYEHNWTVGLEKFLDSKLLTFVLIICHYTQQLNTNSTI